ncbi:MAG: ABC transporter ATP-binding protein [Burkholderiaceae bacterium]
MLRVHDLAKAYGDDRVFEQVSFEVAAGEFVVLVGESGVGKSTLLNCIAGLDEADRGEIVLGEARVGALDADARARLRRERLGFVFQAFHVLPHLSVADNVALPLLLLGGAHRAEAQARVQQLLERVGLAAMGARMPAQLSGGQLQRVALARALVHRPALILADEPTGNLDPANALRMLELLAEQVRLEGAACLLVTHAEAATQRADRVIRLTPTGVTAVAGDP